MTGSLLFIFVASPMLSLLAPALVAMCIAILLFLNGAGVELGAGSWAVLFLIVSAVPTAAFLAAAFLRRIVVLSSACHYSGFELLAVVVATALAFQSKRALSLFGAAGYLSTGPSHAAILEIASIAISHVLFVAALTALVVTIIAGAAELVLGFGTKAVKITTVVSFPAVRQILCLLAVTSGFDLMIGLFDRELAPLTILKSMVL